MTLEKTMSLSLPVLPTIPDGRAFLCSVCLLQRDLRNIEVKSTTIYPLLSAWCMFRVVSCIPCLHHIFINKH